MVYQINFMDICSIYLFYSRSEVTDNSLLINAEVYFPKVVSEGSYKGDSSFGDYQIKSRGIFNVTMCKLIFINAKY